MNVLLTAVAPGGRVVVSGVLADERAPVVRAFAPASVEWEAQEDEWIAVVFQRAG